MKPTEQTAKKHSVKTGLLATLCGLLHAKGTGALKASQGSGAPSRRHALVTLAALATTLGALAFAATPALAIAPEIGPGGEFTSPTVKASVEVNLEAAINPENEATTCNFQYGETVVTEHEVACTEPGPIAEGEEQRGATNVKGLKAGTTYLWRVVLKNASGKIEGGEEKVTTVPLPTTEVPSPIGAETATFKGKLTPLNETVPTEDFFFYNLSNIVNEPTPACTNESATSPAENAGTGPGTTKTVSTPWTGLQPNHEYTVCLDATNQFGSEEGPPVVFKTHPAPPKVDSETASAATSTSVTLEAQVNPNNEEAHAYLQYSTSSAVVGGALTAATPIETPPGAEIGSNYEDHQVGPATLTGLIAGKTYYFQAVATNVTGTTYGTVQPFVPIPVPYTDATSSIGSTTATLHGHFTLNPVVATQYHFVYRLGSACTGEPKIETPTEEAGKGSGMFEVPASSASEVTALQPNAEYTVCLVTSNQFGSESTPSVPTIHFTTLPLPPEFIAGSESASGVASATTPAAELAARINPNNEATSYTFEYSTEGKTGTGETLEGTIFEVNGAVPLEGFNASGETASAHIENLEAGKTYYYRVVAENKKSREEDNPIYGEVEQFTALVSPTVSTGAAQGPTRTSIVLAGTVNPNGVATSDHFAYIDEAGYQAALAGDAQEKANPYINGASTTPQRACPAAELIANPANCDDEGTASVAVEVPVKGLLPGTAYHYALVAGTETGTTVIGSDETFTTAAATPPLVTTAGASEVTLSTATVAGSVNTQGLDVEYAFEVSTEPGNLGQPAGSGTIGAGSGEAGVSLALQGLQPGTTYYYRLLASSTDGTEYGVVLSFTTPGFAPPLIQPGTPLQVGTPNIGFPTGSQSNTQTPSIEVVTHKVKGNTATLEVSVPSAGKLVASGRGLSKATKTSKGATTLTVKLTLIKTEVAFLKRHHAKRLKATIHLTFTTKTAIELTASTTVYIG